MTTRERILEEALTLFSIKGFKGTSVKNIADAVGIKDSSLYKHFRSKQEILDTIIEVMYVHMENLQDKLHIPGNDIAMEDTAEFFTNLTLEELQYITKQSFLFYLTDSYVSRFWRLAQIEQYQNSDVYILFRKIFMEDAIAYQKTLFRALMDRGIFVEAKEEAVAMNFYAPIFFLLTKCSGHEEELDEALRMLEQQVNEFYRAYHVES